jgi:hypothetical protein
MRYYLVALFDDDSSKNIEVIQKTLSKKYKSYKSTQSIYSLIEVIEASDLNKLDEVINKVLKPYKKFKVGINDSPYFEEPYKSLSLKLETRGYINRIARNLNDTLKLNGFDVKDSNQKTNLKVSLCNLNFTPKEFSSKNDLSKLNTNPSEIRNFVTVSKFELWKSTNTKKDYIIKSYSLRDF